MSVGQLQRFQRRASFAQYATREYEQFAREILAEADAVDSEEDEQHGDELPHELSTALRGLPRARGDEATVGASGDAGRRQPAHQAQMQRIESGGLGA